MELIVVKEVNAKVADIKNSIKIAREGFETWKDEDPSKRTKCALRLADLIENNFDEIASILALEAKKTIKDSIFEIREAVDFLRFYASEADKIFGSLSSQAGYTGELSQLTHRPKGIFTCISPWNFPLSIFIGQIAAALVAGNAVIAKPAEQTSKLANYITHLGHKAGFPTNVFNLVVGEGSRIGKYLTESPDISGFVFTGSTSGVA